MPMQASEQRAIELVAPSVAKKFDVAPLAIDEDGTLVLAAVNVASAREVEALLDRKVRTVSASLDEVLARIRIVYPTVDSSGEFSEMHPMARDAIRQLVELRGHDLQFEVGPVYGAIKIAVNGRRFVHRGEIPQADIRAAINSFAMRAGLDMNRAALPRDGRYTLKMGEVTCDFRLQMSPTIHGHWLTVRAHNSLGAVRPLESRGARGLTLERMKRFAEREEGGMFLVTGPIGAGKTSTWYSLLTSVFKPGMHVRTAEQPVEALLPGVGQIEIRDGIEPTFDQIIRSWVRENVDVFGIGELRDTETILAAIQAALLGHRLFTTAHANDTRRALARLRAVDKDKVESDLLVFALNAISNQRLLYCVCSQCAGTEEVPPAIADYARAHALAVPPHLAVAKDKGCKACGGTGYGERTAVFEVLDARNEDVVDAMLANKGPRAIAAADPGFEPIVHDAIGKVLDGLTTVHEIDRLFQFTQGGQNGSASELARVLRLIAAASTDTQARRLAGDALTNAGLFA